MHMSITRRRNMRVAIAREAGGVLVLLAQAVSASVSWRESIQPPGVCRVLSVPAELPSMECICAGRANLTGGLRSIGC
jgi:hypothetical protein